MENTPCMREDKIQFMVIKFERFSIASFCCMGKTH